MAKTDYIIQGSTGFSDQLDTTKNAIVGYTATLGLTPALVAA